MRYPLWLRIAVQNGEILYPEIVQKRYEDALKKRYKNQIKLSLILSDVLTIPAQYREGNYFCDFYYNDERYECVFTEYEISEKKKVKFVSNLDFKPRVDHKFVKKFKDTFPEYDELIIYSSGKGIYWFHNGLQSNLLFWDKTFWYSYYKPDFMTAELERLVKEKRVRLLDVAGINDDATKIMFVNEFEPFDLKSALPLNNSIIANYNDIWQKATFPRLKILLPLILFFTCFFYGIVSPSFEYTNYVYEFYYYLHYPIIIFSIILVYILGKRNHFETVATKFLTKLYVWGGSLFSILVVSILLTKVAFLPYGGKLYTLLKPTENYELVLTNSVRSNKDYPNYKLYGDECNYIIELSNETQNKQYYVCSSKDKNDLGKKYMMEIKESKFGYHIKSLQKMD